MPRPEAAVFHNPISEVTHHFYQTLLVTQTNPETMWASRKLHQGVTTGWQGRRLGAIVKAGSTDAILWSMQLLTL